MAIGFYAKESANGFGYLAAGIDVFIIRMLMLEKCFFLSFLEMEASETVTVASTTMERVTNNYYKYWWRLWPNLIEIRITGSIEEKIEENPRIWFEHFSDSNRERVWTRKKQRSKKQQ